MSASYYVRLRGRVSGPFPVQRLKDLVKQGRFSRVHEVSEDGNSWTSARDVEELFPRPAPVPKQKPDPVKQPVADESHSTASVAGAETNWYYACDGQKLGPLSLPELQSLVLKNEVDGSTLVWTESMPDWQVASQVMQLATLFAKPQAKPQQTASTTAPLVTGVAKPLAWMLFLAIFFAVFSVVLTVAGIWVTGAGFNEQSSIRIATGLFTTVYGTLFLVGVNFFNGFRTQLSRYQKTHRPQYLEKAFSSLHTLVAYVGILVVIYLSFGLVVGIWVISFRGSFPIL